jgi:hypothetical protein
MGRILVGRRTGGMSTSWDHEVAETTHLTEQSFDVALLATQGLVMVDFWAGCAVRARPSHPSSRRSPMRQKAG